VRDQVAVILSLDWSSAELLEVLKVILPVQLILAVKNHVFKTVIVTTPIKIIVILSLKRKNDFPFVQKKIVLHIKGKLNCLGLLKANKCSANFKFNTHTYNSALSVEKIEVVCPTLSSGGCSRERLGISSGTRSALAFFGVDLLCFFFVFLTT
jgi:hypothetical protein